ncbi:MAG TPA: cytochrome b/b6 domain-containing protein [Coriobacteriia bacterium]|nr:cytochrome b/b6 domain-containing protein [Coriobacteriia bacterium]
MRSSVRPALRVALAGWKGSRGRDLPTLTSLNVWMDALFTMLYVVIVIALSGHFLGNILTGRAKRRFGKEWAWPHHDSHPPGLPKFLHFTHVVSMICLGASGLLIRFPMFDRTPMRYVHYFFMWIVIVNLVWRLWYAFSSRRRDYREFAITKRDIVTAPKVILYYIFIKPSKPHLGKYNVMQKGTYILFVPLLIVQALTGLALWRLQLPIVDKSLYTLTAGFVGAGGIFWLRTGHYLVNWLFIILTTIHVYLSVTEDFPAFLDFFGLGFLDRGSNGGHDHDEHGDDHDANAPEPAPIYSAAEHG